MEDYQIIELFWKRDETALKEIREKFSADCRYIAERILGSGKDSEACLSKTWDQAWNSIPPDRPASLKMWLCKAARENALKIYRMRSVSERSVGETSLVLREVRDLLSTENEGSSDSESMKEKLYMYVTTLPGIQRRIFIRRYWYFSPLREIAEDSGLSEEKTVSILQELRNELHEQLHVTGIRKTDILMALSGLRDDYIEDAVPRQISAKGIRIRHFWTMFTGIAALLAISLVFRIVMPDRIQTPDPADHLRETATLEEAEEISGFTLQLPEDWNGCTRRTYAASEDVLVREIMSEDGTVRLSVRKEKKDASAELLSGYPDVRTVIASERTAEIGGYGDRFVAAAFRENGFTYTIEFSPGISREEAAGVIGKIH